jgi:hypothetical protein
VTGKRTQDRRELVLAGFWRSASILRGIVRDLPFPSGERREVGDARASGRANSIHRSAEVQYSRVRLHGVLGMSA